jgi:glyoxylase-like metal-dependent hydrolase (beta-lactamase superfamily II)
MKSGILWGVLVSAVAVGGFAADEGTGGNIFTYPVGRFTVHMLVENRNQGRPSILIGASDAQIQRYFPNGTYESQVNTFLIRGANHCILVDTGFGSTLFESMKILGVDPADVDAILLTHMHGDHIGGLQRNGTALFPNAQVYLAQQEKDFWINTNTAGNAAAALTPYGSRVKTFSPALLGPRSLQAPSEKEPRAMHSSPSERRVLEDTGGPAAELLPGITPIAAFGHTPGHTVFQVADQGQRLFIAGDLVHAQDIQFPVPEISVTYDTDPVAAAAVRKQILEYAAANSIPIGGMHLVSPAIGTVSSQGGGCRFSPVTR